MDDPKSNNEKRHKTAPLHEHIEEMFRVTKRQKVEDLVCMENDTLLQLNDDCLLIIFSKLNLFDLVNIELVCSRFENLVKTFCYQKYRSINIRDVTGDRSKMLMKSRLVLQRIGKYTKKLYIHGNSQSYHMMEGGRVLAMIPSYLRNLEVLICEDVDFYCEEIVKKFYPIFRKVKILSLVSCNLKYDALKTCFFKKSNLVKLDVRSLKSFDVYWLNKIKNLESLTIDNLKPLRPEYLILICLNNNTLTSLNIHDCIKLNSSSFKGITDYLINLKELTISNYYDLTNGDNFFKLADMSKLKKLKIIRSNIDKQHYGYVNVLLKKFAHNNQLESLTLDNIVLGEDTLHDLRYFTKLTELNLRNLINMEDRYLCNMVKDCPIRRLLILRCLTLSNAGYGKCVELCPNLEHLELFYTFDCVWVIFRCFPSILLKRNPKKKLNVYINIIDFPFFEKRDKEMLNQYKDLFVIKNRKMLPELRCLARSSHIRPTFDVSLFYRMLLYGKS